MGWLLQVSCTYGFQIGRNKNITSYVFWDLLVTLHVPMTCRYRNLIERAFRARFVYGSPNMNRAELRVHELPIGVEWILCNFPSISRVLQNLYVHSRRGEYWWQVISLCLQFSYLSSVRKEVLHLIKKGLGARKNIPLLLYMLRKG